MLILGDKLSRHTIIISIISVIIITITILIIIITIIDLPRPNVKGEVEKLGWGLAH